MEQEVSIGIDAMAVEAPSAFVSSQVIAESLNAKRGDIEKLGIRGFRWPTISEGNATIYANALYRLMKSLDGDKKLEEYPIRFNIHSSETNAGSVPDSLFGTFMATSRLLAEDEDKFYRPVTQLYTALPVPLTFNCLGSGIGLEVAVKSLLGEYAATGQKGSAIVSAVDTSVYSEDYSGPWTTVTHGSSGAVALVTFEPRLVRVDPKSFSSFVFNEPGFSKFANSHIPKVNSRISMMAYSYTLGQALHLKEDRTGNSNGHGDYALICGHRPLGEQVYSYLREGYVHDARRKQGAAWKEIVRNMGEPPTKDTDGYTSLFDSKLYHFNRSGPDMTQKGIIDALQADPDLRAYWKWAQKVGELEGHKQFMRQIHIDEALEWGSVLGNSYSVTPLVGLGSGIHNAELPEGARILFYSFGSESGAVMFDGYLVGESKKVRERVLAHLGGEVPLALDQYRDLHKILSQREGERTVTEGNLIERDLEFLKRDALADGFHYINRDRDSTGRWAFSEHGKVTEVFPRHIAPSLRTDNTQLMALIRARVPEQSAQPLQKGVMRLPD